MIEKIVDSQGFKLRYIREGKGLPLLIIGSSHYNQRIFSQNFRNNYDCIFMDHRGFVIPPPDINESAFDLDILLEDIELIRKDTALEKVFLIGHSGHGYLALEYAKKYPQYILGVAIIGMGPDQSDQSNKAAQEYFEKHACLERKNALAKNTSNLAQELEQDPKNALRTLLIRLSAKGWYDYTFDPSSLWKDITINMNMFNHVWGGIFKNIDITQGLKSFDKSVFLALGKYDFIVAPYYLWDNVIPKFKNINLHIFEKSGHTPQYEQAELFDQKFHEWIISFAI